MQHDRHIGLVHWCVHGQQVIGEMHAVGQPAADVPAAVPPDLGVGTARPATESPPVLDFLEHLRRAFDGPGTIITPVEGRPTRWLGWRGRMTEEEAGRNRSGKAEAG